MGKWDGVSSELLGPARCDGGVRWRQNRRSPGPVDAAYIADIIRQADPSQFGLKAPGGDRLARLLEKAKKRRCFGVRRSFDAYRARVLALPEAIEAASPARREKLSRIVVQRVVVTDRRLASIEWVPAVRPLFEIQQECPQGGSGTRPLSHDDVLAWWVA